FTLVLWLFIEPVAVFIAPDPEVSVEAINYLKYNMAAIPFLLVSMILGGALTGAGATFYQMIVMGSSAWLVRIPLAWYLGHVHMREATGIWLAMFISMVVQAILMLYFYQMKDWTKFSQRKGRKIVQPNQTINKLKAGK
ncbi:MAG: MATE family efflux transporter, partial [Desulfonatronovibrio sp.]